MVKSFLTKCHLSSPKVAFSIFWVDDFFNPPKGPFLRLIRRLMAMTTTMKMMTASLSDGPSSLQSMRWNNQEVKKLTSFI